ncbi:hypothetical protein ID866_7735 [Astraeus odoratus]|nr:hypothetical protein ID866_7735 [Astraeus odoratus]
MYSEYEAALQLLARYAHERYINLDGRIERDRNRSPRFRKVYAAVYKGTLLPEGTEVAVKTIYGSLSRGEMTKAVREIHTWSKLRHDNILPLLGVTTEFDRTISVVSPWMNKGNAHEYVKDRAIDPFPLIIGIAHGLQYLHYHTPHPIYHGDLKGSNVLISPEGQALLCDFGLSLVTNSSLEMNLSRTHAGTLFWMAPELFNDCTASPEADVWAFGMTTLVRIILLSVTIWES